MLITQILKSMLRCHTSRPEAAHDFSFAADLAAMRGGKPGGSESDRSSEIVHTEPHCTGSAGGRHPRQALGRHSGADDEIRAAELDVNISVGEVDACHACTDKR